MAGKKKLDVTRTRIVVDKAGLIGVNWPERRLSKTVYMMDSRFCHDLTYQLTRRFATLIGDAKANGEGWTNLASWPGRGVFLVKVRLEAAA